MAKARSHLSKETTTDGVGHTQSQSPKEASLEQWAQSSADKSPSSSQLPGVERTDSWMQDVRERILRLECLGAHSPMAIEHMAATPVSWMTPRMTPRPLHKSPRADDASPFGPKQSEKSRCSGNSGGKSNSSRRRAVLQVSFQKALFSTVLVVVVLVCGIMTIPLELLTSRMRYNTVSTYQKSIQVQEALIAQLTGRAARTAHNEVLRSTGWQLHSAVVLPVNRAVDTLWGMMISRKSINSSWQGDGPSQRRDIAHRALVELVHQFRAHASRAEYLYVGWTGEEFAGARLGCLNYSCDNGMAAIMESVGHTGMPDLMVTPVNTTTLEVATESRNGGNFLPTQRPWFSVQSRLAQAWNASRIDIRREWSGIYMFRDKTLGLTFTAPVAFCGDYSCFNGVVAADITLPAVSESCVRAWNELNSTLAHHPYQFPIDDDNSAVFVVTQKIDLFPEQEGALVGASAQHALGGRANAHVRVIAAENSEQQLVALTAKTIKERYGSFKAEGLLDGERRLTFRRSDALRGDFSECTKLEKYSPAYDDDCFQVGTSSVPLSHSTKWLVIMVSPSRAFSAIADSTKEAVDMEVHGLENRLDELVSHLHYSAVGVFAAVGLFSLGLGVLLSHKVTEPLKQLSGLLRRLGDLEFSKLSAQNLQQQAQQRFQISDVSELQSAYLKLARGLEAFARFVPEAVVRSIVRGDDRATRLHVSQRHVTIMFSDIRNFTKMAEHLSCRDLLLVLTRYLSIMTRIAEHFEGVVAEILGDGLLIFWNTPEDVENHAAKACAAALAMQQALHQLNYELNALHLPTIAIRIGIHTGQVLSGNIGSEVKMKFGCMGDPVNLASRLEGLCKMYGVGIICSSDSFELLSPEAGFVCRKLDLVQVQGRATPTLLYEVMARQFEEESDLQEGFYVASSGQVERNPAGSPVAADLEKALPQQRSHSSVKPGALPVRCVCLAVQKAFETSTKSLNCSNIIDWEAEQRKVRTGRIARLQSWYRNGSRSSADGTASASASTGMKGLASIASHMARFWGNLAAGEAPDNNASPGQTPMPLRETPSTGGVVARLLARASRYEAALEAYQQQRFENARDILEELLRDEEAVNDEASQRLLTLVRREIGLREDDEGSDALQSEKPRSAATLPWTGVTVMTEK
eukprot:TRINITY_DN25619_c0_g2_i1.p1 TRINITY_DN25619_c0_g2~~TRINITY_DN25619_c0_g2_i1.p1  ORF type:complete len:1262 (+),score=245.48 TRINITY_DN25619_c0_g2_i1:351-3788(+)